VFFRFVLVHNTFRPSRERKRESERECVREREKEREF